MRWRKRPWAGGARRGQASPAGTFALIQDYHLSLAPRLLGERLGDTARDIGVAHFSHTPWAPPRYYRLLPREVGRALLNGMLGAAAWPRTASCSRPGRNGTAGYSTWPSPTRPGPRYPSTAPTPSR